MGWLGPYRHHLFAILAIAAVAAGRLVLAPVLNDDAPLLPFTLAVVVGSWWGGLRVGLYVTALSAVVGELLFVAPFGWAAMTSAREAVRVAIFVTAGGFVSYAIHLLRQARRDAERAVRQKDELIAVLAHELSAPLSAIHAAIGVMKTRLSDERRTWARDVIERQSLLMNRLVADLLDVSRISRRAFDIQRQPTSLVSVIDGAVAAVESLLREREQIWEVRLADVDSIVLVDAGRLQQAITNLLTNASRYTPPRGRITLQVEIDHSRAKIMVSDSGLGIAREQLDRLFRPFERGPASSGLGIGLFLAQTLVTYNGGTLTAASAGLGTGSTFTIELPIVRVEYSPHPAVTTP
jgi:signal transduction histidine kinase